MPSLFRLTIIAALGLAVAGCANLPGFGPEPKHLAASIVEIDPLAARDMISAYRASHGLAAVTIDPVLETVARKQAMAMATADLLSHTVDGNLGTRLDSVGMKYSNAVENVSAGYDTQAQAIAGWRRSPPHDANLLNAKVRRMGIASATAPNSHYKTYWSLVMTD